MQGLKIRLRLGHRPQFRINLKRIAQEFQGFLRTILHRAVTGHIKIRKCVPRIRMECPLQGRGRGFNGLRPPADIRQINPKSRIMRVEFGELSHERLRFFQPVLLPENRRLDTQGVGLARRQSQSHIRLAQRLIKHF